MALRRLDEASCEKRTADDKECFHLGAIELELNLARLCWSGTHARLAGFGERAGEECTWCAHPFITCLVVGRTHGNAPSGSRGVVLRIFVVS